MLFRSLDAILIGGQTQPGWRPAPKIREAGNGANVLHFLERSSSAVPGADQSADACPGDTIDGDACFAKYAEHADVRDPARESPGESQADTRALSMLTLLAEGKRMKLVFCSAKPSERAGGFSIFCHLFILTPGQESGRAFDRRMPVL